MLLIQLVFTRAATPLFIGVASHTQNTLIDKCYKSNYKLTYVVDETSDFPFTVTILLEFETTVSSQLKVRQ